MIKVSLFAEQEREARLDRIGDALSKLAAHVDFAALAAEIDEAAPRPGRERGGRPPFPTELMVRVLVIQQLYNLSDEQMEFQLLDRLSFQRFVGLRQSSQAPDRTTIWTFKERLIKTGASERIFEAVNRQLDRQGYIARGGQMIDASIVPVPRQTLTRDEKEMMIQQDAMPAEWSPPKRRQKDVQARWTKKHGKSDFGYKLSTSVDKRHKLIRRVQVSTASENDTLHFERVLDPGNTSREVCADKGYLWHLGRRAMGRPKLDLGITAEERRELEAIAGSRSFPHGLVRRAQMILWSGEGLTVREVARRTKVTPAAVSNWRKRFREARVPAISAFTMGSTS